jgi:hypothetical protein
MKRLVPLLALALLGSTTDALAKPSICKKKGVAEVLAAGGKDAQAGVAQHICGDVTGDGKKDVVFTLLSGGTAGPIRFGVIGRTEGILLYEEGYPVTVDRVNPTRFDVQQPFYKKSDANCCPSAFDVTPYRFRNGAFKAGKSRRYKHFQERFGG